MKDIKMTSPASLIKGIKRATYLYLSRHAQSQSLPHEHAPRMARKGLIPAQPQAHGIERAKPFQNKNKVFFSAKLRKILYLVLGVTLWVAPLLAAPHVTPTAIPSHTHITPGADMSVAIRLDIAPGWHIYGEKPGAVGVPTRITWQTDTPTVTFGEMSWPTPSRFETAGIESFGYQNTVIFPFEVRISEQVQVGRRLELVADIRWIACREICIPESAQVTWSVMVSAEAVSNPSFSTPAPLPPGGTSNTGWRLAVVMVLSAFLGGLILNVMPCVFPVLSLKLFQLLPESEAKVDAEGHGLSNVGNHGGTAPAGLRRNIFAYAMGIMVSFWVMSLVLLVLRHTLGVVGWGIQLQYPAVVFSLMLLFLVLALNFFGLFEIGLSLQKWGQPSRSHAQREFFSGVLIVLVATPCTAPFLGAAIGFALSQAAWVMVVVLTAMGLGLASPMVALAFWPKLLHRMPKPGAWMIRVRQFLGFPMLASVIWLLWVLLQQWGPAPLVPLLGLMLCVALGMWVVGVFQHKGWFRMGTWLLVAVVGLSALVYWGVSPKVSAPVEATAFAPFSEAALQAAREAGKPVFVDVTAAWCLTCQVNKKTVLETDKAQALFAKHGVVLLRADWTTQDQRITAYLATFGRSGVPMYVYYAPGKEGVVLPEVLRLGVLVAFLGTASPESPF